MKLTRYILFLIGLFITIYGTINDIDFITLVGVFAIVIVLMLQSIINTIKH